MIYGIIILSLIFSLVCIICVLSVLEDSDEEF